jgi:hypothetical protein
MEYICEIRQLLMEFIHEWEQKNDSSLMLNFHSFECKVINPRLLHKYPALCATLLIDAPYIPNNVQHIYSSRNVKLPPKLPQSLKILSIELYKYSIPELPDTLEELYVSGRDIVICKLPSNLRIFSCFGLLLSHELPQLPLHLETLICTHCNLRMLPLLPNTLKVINVQHNEVMELSNLPENLEKLDVSYNSLKELPSLPDSLKIIDCSCNLLKNIPTLPARLESLVCDTNNLEELPICPPSLRYLMFYNNKFRSSPVVPDTVLQYVGGEYGNRIIPDS